MKPIVFNTEMVKAILDGRKTQFREVVKLEDNTLIHTGYIIASTNRKRQRAYYLRKEYVINLEKWCKELNKVWMDLGYV